MIILDGATGSEIQRRGVTINKGSSKKRRLTTPKQYAEKSITKIGSLGVWSATANVDAPVIVQQIHEDYLRVGAEVIISNNFYTNRSMLKIIGKEKEWKKYAGQAVKLAIRARNAVNPKALIAGGFAPSERKTDFKKECENVAKVLVKSGVDILLPEYFGADVIQKSPIEDCVTVVKACNKFNLPIWLGIGRVTEQGTMMHGETFEDLVKALTGLRVDAILLMCSSPKAISACLTKLRKVFKGLIGAYAEIGYDENPKYVKNKNEPFFKIRQTVTPKEYLEYAKKWKRLGASIIGGCCGTTPEYIKLLNKLK